MFNSSSLLYTFEPPTEDNAHPYWHLSEEFMELQEDLEQDIDRIMLKLCQWLDKHKAEYPDRILATHLLEHIFHYSQTNMELDWNDAAMGGDNSGIVRPGVVPFRFRDPRQQPKKEEEEQQEDNEW